MGGTKTYRFGYFVFFNDEIYDEEDLKVPHPDMQNRYFVLKPLCEICPDFVHPILKKES